MKFYLGQIYCYLFQEFWLTFETKVLELEIRHLGILRALERTLIMIYINNTEMERTFTKNGFITRCCWVAKIYGQRNPLLKYKDEAYEYFKR
jgi:hypothetical protein